MKQFQCPRRRESYLGELPVFARDNDYDDRDDSCKYCGSLAADTFMARVEAGDVELESTDKNYKVYIHNSGGQRFKQTYRDCPRDEQHQTDCKGPDTCTHWVTREVDRTKFYFQHLSKEQRVRFVDLMNEKGKLKFTGGFGFYVYPFFVARKSEAVS